jgi:hypothetical protein
MSKVSDANDVGSTPYTCPSNKWKHNKITDKTLFQYLKPFKSVWKESKTTTDRITACDAVETRFGNEVEQLCKLRIDVGCILSVF